MKRVGLASLALAVLLMAGCGTESENSFVIGDVAPGHVKVVDANTSKIPFLKSDHRLTAWRDDYYPYTLHVDVEGADSSSLGSMLSNPLNTAVSKFQWGVPAF